MSRTSSTILKSVPTGAPFAGAGAKLDDAAGASGFVVGSILDNDLNFVLVQASYTKSAGCVLAESYSGKWSLVTLATTDHLLAV